ncbi:unnamed protein product [Pleuronectes platessa]|uniref:Uncharacterized protein n=1 Tax=Pleuronectes platessa TaxID=8262 RepID=A0A9N7ZA79_PLEPL|nr:unnamed protein product [Pleuronectes platessa]
MLWKCNKALKLIWSDQSDLSENPHISITNHLRENKALGCAACYARVRLHGAVSRCVNRRSLLARRLMSSLHGDGKEERTAGEDQSEKSSGVPAAQAAAGIGGVVHGTISERPLPSITQCPLTRDMVRLL